MIRISSERVKRGEDVLNRLVRAGKISKAGMAAYLAAVDPYHDTPIVGLEGHPDGETSPSVVRTINGSYTIKATEDGGSILIWTMPIINGCALRRVNRRNAIVDTVLPIGTGNTGYVAPGNIHTYSAAASSASNGLSLAGQAEAWAWQVPDAYFADGPVRMIGMGVEVHDVTADLYKQGTCTVFEFPQAIGERESVVVAAQTVDGTDYLQTSQQVCPMNKFPDDLAEMALYPTFRQWEARHGAYAVVPFTGQDNYPLECEYRSPWIYGSESDNDKPNSANITSKFLGAFLTTSPDGDHFVFYGNNFTPVHSKGIYLSGLNANSTFNVTFRMYLETFPTAASNLVTLAKPSAKLDTGALALISAAMKRMPVAVPVGDNLSGDWFWETLEAALPYLGGIASVFLPEFSPLIAAGTAAGVSALRQRKAKKKKNKPLPPIPQARKKPSVPPPKPKRK